MGTLHAGFIDIGLTHWRKQLFTYPAILALACDPQLERETKKTHPAAIFVTLVM